ncbi:16S rRNA (guanine(966)-N(2))-methyltransferase RsmD [Ignatzschineria rhizosphaerae]|uniref:Ribosomal RNA small subunit methyltransferase D n=1 Tax=Ignatzschineria rhizosphaerae TaxID=2923279 RepID=A0ABY3X2Q6_9GAMM|nr:16S rRNA (guanine(966)-N(2))-methyltransferase RsmD [Ignatzschineria rhizosphaerae]UNM96175.1 16S rRNA (guanine(966)-N(2))-methyltransferase RsmD [Ignatzschineria rhizosphaerae]
MAAQHHFKKNQRPNHQIQIIGGEYRSRKIEVIDADGLRPTSSRVRETLFNWLQMIIPGSIVIDAFAGTGALGIESLSRGAKKAIFIEKDPTVFKTLKENITHLKIPKEKFILLNTDGLKFLQDDAQLQSILKETPAADTRCHLFLDPPFFAGFYPELLATLSKSELLHQITSLSIESPLKLAVSAASTLTPLELHREMKTKESLLQLYRK